MADPQPSKVDNDPFTIDVGSCPDETYEDGMVMWIAERVREGEGILKDDPMYEEMDKAINYIMGDQVPRDRPTSLSNCPDNRLKNVLNQTVAALTDIHPLFGFKTYNDHFKDQEDVLMKLSASWWVNTFADLKLADVIKFAAGVGTGYCEVAWDSSAFGGAGDIVLRSIDPRDVLPIRPTLTGSIQDWGGVIVRTAKSPEELRLRYPDKAHRIQPDNQPSIVARTWSRARALLNTWATPSAVDNINSSNAHNAVRKMETTDVYVCHLKDRRLSIDNQPRIMGDPSITWSYTVYPAGWSTVPNGMDNNGQPQYRTATIEDSRLYPRGRMIIATKKAVLYDGPNPYWHGMFPIAKLSLDPWPWSLLGQGLAHDLMPLQDALNETLNGILDHVRKLLRPAVVADKKVIANSSWERMDTRIPGLKIKTPAGVGGKSFEIVSPEPLPPYTMEVLTFLTSEMDYHAGTANMMALTQLQQVPGEDTIEKMQEALTPVLRLKGRLLEYFLREMGEMVKANFFQFYNMPRRVAMLGDEGMVMNDFDFDPGTLVPSLAPGDPGWEPKIDKSIPRAERAQWFHKNFTFQITPNSILSISQMGRKMMYMMLRKDMLIDRWTLYDVMEIPNGGTAPGGAQTITDRLQAEMMLFPPPGVPPGRPNTMAQPPSLQSKDGGTRPVLSTSGGGGPNPQ